MLFVCHPKILHKYCLQFLLRVKMAPRETENNAYAKFWGDKQRALWYVMVFSGVVNIKFVSVLVTCAIETLAGVVVGISGRWDQESSPNITILPATQIKANTNSISSSL